MATARRTFRIPSVAPVVRLLAVAFALCLGAVGFVQAYDGLAQHPGFVRIAVQSVRLIVGSFPADLDGRDLPLTLSIARIALPLLTFWTTIALAWMQVRNPLRLNLMRQRGEHLVVVGASDLARIAVRGELDAGRSVLVVTRDIRDRWVAEAQDRGAAAIEVDDGLGNLAQLGLGRARRVLLLDPDDTGNAALAARLVEQTAKERPAGDPLPVITRVDDLELRSGIEARFERLGHAAARIRFASLPDIAARRLFLEMPLDRLRRHDEPARRVFVFGFSPTVERYVLRMLAGGHFRDGIRPQFTVLDPAAPVRAADFRQRQPDADSLAPLAFVTADFASVQQAVQALTGQCAVLGEPVAIVVDCGDDTRSLATALAFDEHYRHAGIGAPLIHVHMATGHDRRLGCMIHAFGNLDDFGNSDLLVQEDHDRLARSIHDFYLEGRLGEGERLNARASLREWEDLPEGFRDDNRLVADCYQLKLHDIGARLIAGQGAPLRFEPDELEALARAEHDRWMAAKLAAGWTYGPERDDARRIHPDIVGYDELSERIKDLDREQIRVMTRLLASTGQRAARLLCVALDPMAGPRLPQAMPRLIADLAANYPDRVVRFAGLLDNPPTLQALSVAAAAGHLVQLFGAGNIQTLIDNQSAADRMAVIDLVCGADALVLLPAGEAQREAALVEADLIVTSATTTTDAAAPEVRIDAAGEIVAAPWLR